MTHTHLNLRLPGDDETGQASGASDAPAQRSGATTRASSKTADSEEPLADAPAPVKAKKAGRARKEAGAAPAAPALAPPVETRRHWLKLTPINRRRLDNFKRNKRGWWSFWLFIVLFVLSLFAEFIANDRPLYVSYKGEALFPVFVDYPEEKFGGFLPQTDYRDPVIAQEIEANGFAIWPPVSTTRCWPVQAGWDFGSMSSRSVSPGLP